MFEEAPLVIRSLVKTQFSKPFGFDRAPDLLPDPEGLVFLLPSRYIQR